MSLVKGKPRHLVLTDILATKIAVAWAVASIFIMSGSMKLGVSVVISLVVLLFYFLAKWLVQLLFLVQKWNPLMSKPIYDFFIFLFWVFGIFCAAVVMISFFSSVQGGGVNFIIIALACPLGFSAGASVKWEQRFFYK